MKKSSALTIAIAVILSSCGTTAQLSSTDNSARFQDGIYSSSPSFRTAQQKQEDEARTDELVRKTKESAIYLFGDKKDTVMIPENMSARIQFDQKVGGTVVTVGENPYDWRLDLENNYGYYYGPYSIGSSWYWSRHYSPWYSLDFAPWRYRGWYDAWHYGSWYSPYYYGGFYGGWYDPWYWGSSWGWYDPWYSPYYCGWHGHYYWGHSHHHHYGPSWPGWGAGPGSGGHHIAGHKPSHQPGYRTFENGDRNPIATRKPSVSGSQPSPSRGQNSQGGGYRGSQPSRSDFLSPSRPSNSSTRVERENTTNSNSGGNRTSGTGSTTYRRGTSSSSSSSSSSRPTYSSSSSSSSSRGGGFSGGSSSSSHSSSSGSGRSSGGR